MGKQWKQWQTLLPWAPKSLQMVIAAMKLKDVYSLEESYEKPRQHIKKQKHYFTDKGPYSQSYDFSSSHVWICELDHLRKLNAEELTHRKRPWRWARLKARRKGNVRGWDGWMASLTQRTWVWVSFRSWWWTGRPGVLQSMGVQRVRHDWGIELTEGFYREWYKVGVKRFSFFALISFSQHFKLNVFHSFEIPTYSYTKFLCIQGSVSVLTVLFY